MLGIGQVDESLTTKGCKNAMIRGLNFCSVSQNGT